MQNVKMTMKGKTLTIEIDVTERHGNSSSGKSTIVASTGGNVSVPGHEEVKIGINCYVPVGK